MSKEAKKDNWFRGNFVLLVIIFIVVGWLSTFFLLYFDEESNVGDIGRFGDMFGAVNALFSGLAFAGMIYAIRLQSKELSQTNKEMEVQSEMLKLQKEELTETRKEFQRQNQTLILQRFENTFFHLLSQHHQILDNLSFVSGNNILRRSDVINLFCKSLVNIHRGRYIAESSIGKGLLEVNTSTYRTVETKEEGFKAISQSYSKCLLGGAFDLSHYFRNVYHIFKFIFQSNEISKERQQFYVSIVVAQLSQEEQLLIFYNMMIPGLGYPKFLYLDKYFDILGNMDRRKLEQYSWQIELFEFLKEELPVGMDLSKKSSLVPSFQTN